MSTTHFNDFINIIELEWQIKQENENRNYYLQKHKRAIRFELIKQFNQNENAKENQVLQVLTLNKVLYMKLMSNVYNFIINSKKRGFSKRSYSTVATTSIT